MEYLIGFVVGFIVAWLTPRLYLFNDLETVLWRTAKRKIPKRFHWWDGWD